MGLSAGTEHPHSITPNPEILLPPKNAHSNACCASFSLGLHKLLLWIPNSNLAPLPEALSRTQAAFLAVWSSSSMAQTAHPPAAPLTHPHSSPPGWGTAPPRSLSCTSHHPEWHGGGRLSIPKQRGHGMSCRMDGRLREKINTPGYAPGALSPLPSQKTSSHHHLLLQNMGRRWSNGTRDCRAVVWKALTSSFWINKMRNGLPV